MSQYSFLFETTAPYYARFRPSYPPEFVEHVVQRFGLDGRGSLLDLGCGTGQLTAPLAPYFAQVIGMDPETEMLEQAEQCAKQASISNIRWLKGGSTNLHSGLGPIRLVTMANGRRPNP